MFIWRTLADRLTRRFEVLMPQLLKLRHQRVPTFSFADGEPSSHRLHLRLDELCNLVLYIDESRYVHKHGVMRSGVATCSPRGAHEKEGVESCPKRVGQRSHSQILLVLLRKVIQMVIDGANKRQGIPWL